MGHFSLSVILGYVKGGMENKLEKGGFGSQIAEVLGFRLSFMLTEIFHLLHKNHFNNK